MNHTTLKQQCGW